MGIVEPLADNARVYENLGVIYGTVDREGLAALRADPSVRKVEPAPQFSLIRPVARAAATLRTEYTWGLEFLENPHLWGQGLTGKGIRVGHLDTGVDGTHPALEGAVTKFAEIDRTGRERPGVAAWDSDDRDRHGTHTAATIAGREVAKKHIGVAPGAEAVINAYRANVRQRVQKELGGVHLPPSRSDKLRHCAARL
jgi:subtilisin family serine protease